MDTSTDTTPIPRPPVMAGEHANLPQGMAVSTRINLLGYLGTLGSSAVIGVLCFLLSAHALLQNSRDDAQAALELIARENTVLIRSDDLTFLHKRLEQIGQFPGVAGILINDNNQRPIASFSTEGRSWNPGDLAENSTWRSTWGLLEILTGPPWATLQTPILSGNQKVGTLFLVWDLSRIHSQIRQLLIAVSAAFLVILLVTAALTKALQRSLGRPVKELLNAIHGFTGGVSTARSARVFARDELGELTASFNAMLARLLEQRRELHTARTKLEERVADRTAELETRRREAETAQHELRRITDLSLDILLLIDENGCGVSVSSAVTDILGYSEAELLGRNIHELMYSKDRVETDGEQLRVQEFLQQQGGQIHNVERRFVHRNGQKVWMEWSLTLLDDNRVFMVGRDIQDRKKKEVELMVAHKAETIARKRAEQIVDISLDVIVTLDSSGRYLEVSRASAQMFGYAPDELRGRLFTDFIAEEEFDAENIGPSLIETVREAGGSLGGQIHKFRHKQGHWVWVEWNIALQENENAMYGIARDITERREYEQALITARNEVQQVIDMSLDLIVTLTPDGTILTVNAASERLIGYRPEELIGFDIQPLINQDDMALHSVHKLFDKIKSDGGELNGLVRRFRHKTGRWVSVELNFVLHNEGKDTLIHATGRDVTDRITYEQELITAREIAEAATATKSTFLANMSHEIRTPLNGVMGMLQLLNETQIDIEQAGYLGTALSSSATLLTLINDILDYSKIEAGKLTIETQPLNLLELLEDVMAIFGKPAADKSVNLSAILSPQISTHIFGDVTRLRQVLTNLIGNAMKFTEKGEIVCHGSLEMAQGTTLLRIDVSDTGIGIAAEKLKTIFDSFSQADDSTTRQYGGTGLGLAISEQLVTLMDGAISVTSTPGSGSTFTITLPLVTADAPGFGYPGIESKRVLIISEAASVREAIGVIFARAGMQATMLPIWQHNLKHLLLDGSAFDLVVADSMLLTDDMGIEWVAKPTLPTLAIAPYGRPLSGLPDQFRQIYKPISSKQLLGFSAELLGLTQDIQVFKSEEIKPPSARILLVEDNAVNRKVASRMLEKLDMQIAVAEDGQEAVNLLTNESFDLVLMDCQMPVLDGYAATMQIRAAEKETGCHQTIIALTANVEGKYRQRCLDAGMDDFLAKPYRKEALAEILNRWLESVPPSTYATRPVRSATA